MKRPRPKPRALINTMDAGHHNLPGTVDLLGFYGASTGIRHNLPAALFALRCLAYSLVHNHRTKGVKP